MEQTPCPAKKARRTSTETDEILENFLNWATKVNLKLSEKVKVVKNGSVSRYGMIATELIEEDETLFTIPRSALLWERTSKISELLCNVESLSSKSNWVKLLLCLMYEYSNKSTSNFSAYMEFCPKIHDMDQPMFWSQECKEWLKGTGVLELVENDCKAMEQEFHDIALPFIKNHSDQTFDPEIHNLDLYKHMVAFVMSYSFTDTDDSKSPKMVPMADVLNHTAKNNASLEFGENSLKMLACKRILPGQEIYNTYGCLSNEQLLQMYGFVEKHPLNVFDTVDIHMSKFYEVLVSYSNVFKPLDGKITFLKEKGDLTDTRMMTLSYQGILTCDEMKLLTKVLPMSSHEFSSFDKNFDEEEWESSESTDGSGEEDETEFEVFPYSRIAKLTQDVKKFFKEVVSNKLDSFHELFSSSSCTEVKFADEKNQWRFERSQTLVNGQREILLKFLSFIEK